jgi:hypothetical protein
MRAIAGVLLLLLAAWLPFGSQYVLFIALFFTLIPAPVAYAVMLAFAAIPAWIGVSQFVAISRRNEENS